jgi:hypothetical protein
VTGRRGALGDRGTALIATAIGVLVFLLFLLFAVQLLFSLYATSTITAVTNDAVQRAATSGHDDIGAIERDARDGLGAVGDAAEFTWEREDADGDGTEDTIALRVTAHPPRFVPPSIGDAVGLTEVEHTARARIEEFR